ncbi:MAG: DUF554 domain-containing protein [Clostridia bacterium]|nr:DUF554 domain-containing protein [Clostridia bacterium]
MPTGILINILAVLLGSLLGCLIAKRIPQRFQEVLPSLFGFCSIAIGVNSIIKVSSLAVPVIAVLVGYCIGGLLKLEERCHGLLKKLLPKVVKGSEGMDMTAYITVTALFCFSGVGWYGVLSESIGGVPDILYAKSVMDFFTAVLFAALLGRAVCLIPIGQTAVFILLFLLGKLIAPMTTPDMFNALTACGGIISVATGFRVSKIRIVPLIDMMPALLLVLVLAKIFA